MYFQKVKKLWVMVGKSCQNQKKELRKKKETAPEL